MEFVFSPNHRAPAVALLDVRCGYSVPGFSRAPDAEIERIRYAALKLSDGDLQKLKRTVEDIRLDFRDVILEAGFGEVGSDGNWFPPKR